MMTPSHKLALTAGLALAAALTFSCSGDGGGSEPAHEHVWGEWEATTPATCEAAGLKTRTCAGDQSHTEVLPLAQLTWEWVVTTLETPMSAGLETKTCPNGDLDGTRPRLPFCGGVAYDPSATKTFCDKREQRLYKYVTIGGQTWMAENLGYNEEGSRCYAQGVEGVSSDSVAKNCAAYGRLYNWATAKTACPSGWHLPNDAEWNVLMKFVNPACSDNSTCAEAGTKLKAASGWNPSAGVPAGTDEFGFSALPGGDGGSDGGFFHVGIDGYWWSASEYSSNLAYGRDMYYDSECVNYNGYGKGRLFSVRCVQD